MKERRSRAPRLRRIWPRVADWSHARLEPRPHSQDADCFRGKSVSLQNEVSRVAAFRVVPAILSRVAGRPLPEDPREAGTRSGAAYCQDLRARIGGW